MRANTPDHEIVLGSEDIQRLKHEKYLATQLDDKALLLHHEADGEDHTRDEHDLGTELDAYLIVTENDIERLRSGENARYTAFGKTFALSFINPNGETTTHE